MKIDFTKFIKKDEIIQNYTAHAITIHMDIINNDNTADISKLSQVGIYLILVAISSRYIDIIHHYTLSRYNFLTKKLTLAKVIISLKDKESAIEIKDLGKETILKGKLLKLDKLLEIIEDMDI